MTPCAERRRSRRRAEKSGEERRRAEKSGDVFRLSDALLRSSPLSPLTFRGSCRAEKTKNFPMAGQGWGMVFIPIERAARC
jgi:hypothetical protein